MKNYLLHINKKVKDALYQLEKNEEKCLIIVDSNNILKGTITDGDIRRAILSGASINSEVKKYIKKNPYFIKKKDNKNTFTKEIIEKISKIKDSHIDVVPLVDKKNKINEIIFTKKFNKQIPKKNILKNIPTLIMAGGKGKRLKQFTNYFPKPLVPFEDTTATEYIINSFKKYGVKKFYMSLNYKKKLIKSYFKENKVNNLSFLEERNFLGTAGAVSLLQGKVKSNFFVINCDTLLSINLDKFYEYHNKNNYKITLVAASKNFKLSYGSCEVSKNGQLKKIVEKPNINYLANVGLYLLRPEVIKLVKKNKLLEMDELVKKVKQKGGKVGVFPISEEDWKDTGEQVK